MLRTAVNGQVNEEGDDEMEGVNHLISLFEGIPPTQEDFPVQDRPNVVRVGSIPSSRNDQERDTALPTEGTGENFPLFQPSQENCFNKKQSEHSQSPLGAKDDTTFAKDNNTLRELNPRRVTLENADHVSSRKSTGRGTKTTRKRKSGSKTNLQLSNTLTQHWGRKTSKRTEDNNGKTLEQTTKVTPAPITRPEYNQGIDEEEVEVSSFFFPALSQVFLDKIDQENAAKPAAETIVSDEKVSDDEEDEDDDNAHVHSICLGLSQKWECDGAIEPETESGDEIYTRCGPEEYTYDPPHPRLDPVGTRTYRKGEFWHEGRFESDPKFLYEILGFKLTGSFAKQVLAQPWIKTTKTILSDEQEYRWVRKGKENQTIPMRNLTAFKQIDESQKLDFIWEQKKQSCCVTRWGFVLQSEHPNPTKAILNHGPRVLELFGGGGGMSVGFKQAGFDVRWIVENNITAYSTLRANFPEADVFDEDANEFLRHVRKGHPSYPKRGDPEHIHASSPCNPFSSANRAPGGGKNAEYEKSLVLTWVDAIRHYLPKTATFENVPGLLFDRHITHLKAILAQLTELKYNVVMYILDAADFGDPQARERLIILASMNGMAVPNKPEATHGDAAGLASPRTIRDAIGDLAYIDPGTGSGRIFLNGGTVTGHCSDGTEIKSEQTYLDPDKPASTLYGKFTNSAVHYEHRRLYTIRELARLQSFPDKHIFPSNRNQARKLIYNAVPTNLAHAVARSVIECYDIVE